jgi:hypothetical protein
MTRGCCLAFELDLKSESALLLGSRLCERWAPMEMRKVPFCRKSSQLFDASKAKWKLTSSPDMFQSLKTLPISS